MRIASATLPTLVLLPGLDGTGDLFGPLLAVLPRGVVAHVVSYPANQALSYEVLLERIGWQVSTAGEIVLVAESFSGPLALRYAAAHGGRVRAVVLCASFIQSPLPRWLRWLVTPVLFRLPLPGFAVRLLLVGRDAPGSLLHSVQASIRKVNVGVLAARLKDVFGVNCSEALAPCEAPILYLRPTRDALVPRSAILAMQTIRRVEVRSVRGSHLLLQAEPSACWTEIQAFMNRHQIEV